MQALLEKQEWQRTCEGIRGYSKDALEQQLHLLASPFLLKKLVIFTSMWFVLPSQIREYVNITIHITRTLGAQEH